ncbi:MAG: molybdopterin-dependent oxidoreductase [Dehalococcoidales bacterium]|nr:molybdopterin-dependent oxidoreductase [Dehalococcoidales bacterium]
MRKIINCKVIIYMVFSVAIVAANSCDEGRVICETEELEHAEIREYEGEKLSSVSDFRENSIRGPQYINIENYQLEISGLVEHLGDYTYDEITDGYQHYQKMVTLDCVEGWSVDIFWEGILIRDLINPSKPLPDAKVVIFHAYDGYSTSFPIDYILDNDIIMAYKMNGIDLPTERGYPFQLVAESKWGYKWIKWITRIELSDDTSYEGFWESRGYSNTGDLDENFLK